MIYDAKRYYAMLGVEPGCADEEIRAAFRRLAKEQHPDSETGSVSAFIRLKKAYDTLADPEKRAQYDHISRPRPVRQLPDAELMMSVPRPRRYRLGGMSITRFAAAFVFMTSLSFVAIEIMLEDADVPLSAMFDFGRPESTTTRIAPVHEAERKEFSIPLGEALKIQPGENQDEYEDRLQRLRHSGDLGQGLATRP